MRGHIEITFTSQNHSSFVEIRTRGTLSYMSSYCHPPTTLGRFVLRVASSISASQFNSYIDKSQENINTALAPRTECNGLPNPAYPPNAGLQWDRRPWFFYQMYELHLTKTSTGRRRTMWKDGGYQVQMYELHWTKASTGWRTMRTYGSYHAQMSELHLKNTPTGWRTMWTDEGLQKERNRGRKG